MYTRRVKNGQLILGGILVAGLVVMGAWLAITRTAQRPSEAAPRARYHFAANLDSAEIRALPASSLPQEMQQELQQTGGWMTETLSAWTRRTKEQDPGDVWYAPVRHRIEGKGWEQITPPDMVVTQGKQTLPPERRQMLGEAAPGSWNCDDHGVFMAAARSEPPQPPGPDVQVTYPSVLKVHMGLNHALVGGDHVPFVDRSVTLPIKRGKPDAMVTKRSLFAPAPTHIEYTVTIPDDAVLSFHIGLLKRLEGGASDGVTFQITVRDAEGEKTLFEQALPGGRANDGRWHHHTVDLASYAGREVTLAFKTYDPAGNELFDYATWGDPALGGHIPEGGRGVILISIDTLRADHLGAYGYERDTSPAIDRLASEGTLFERTYSHGAWTLPTHASLFTSQIPSEHGVIRGNRKIRESLVTLPETLQANGFQTQGFSAVGLVSHQFGFEQGFDSFSYQMGATAEGTIDQVIDWLRDERRGSFFLFVHFFDPHDPYWPADPQYRSLFDPSYRGDAGRKPEAFENLRVSNPGGRLSEREFEHLMALYDGEIRYVDHHLARLFAALEAPDLQDAFVVVTADHGEEFRDHGGLGHARSLYEEMVHVPLVIRGPGIPRGVRVKTPARHIDVAPTLLDVLGLPAEPTHRGTSLMPLVENPETADARVAVLENQRWWFDQVAVVVGDRKYHWDLNQARGRSYNLDVDPAEQVPLQSADDLRGVMFEQLGLSERHRWNLAWSGGDAAHVFEGSITAEGGVLVDLKPSSFESEDDVTLADDHKSLTFRVVAGANHDELTFEVNPPGAVVELRATIDGKQGRSPIFLGRRRRTPDGAGPVRLDDSEESTGRPRFKSDAGLFIWSEPFWGRAQQDEASTDQDAATLGREEREQLQELGYLE